MSSSSLFKVAASTHTITPWRDWQEWKACKDGLIGTPTHHGVNTPTGVDSSADGPDVCGDFAEEKKRVRSRRRRALHTVNVWRARGRVPLAVDSTAQLIELNLQHEEDGPPAQSAGVAATPASAHFAASNQETTAHHANTTLQSRLQYSIALLRLVNGVLDPMQAKQHAQSVLTLAKQMQMPRLLVDLRHESTHQGLPSLPLLRHASHVALDWLSRHYWSAQSHAISKVDEAIRHQLKAYKQGADAERQKRDERKRRKKQEDEEGEDGQAKDDMTVAINSGDAIMFDAAPVAAEKAAMPEKSQEALKALFTTITSGHSLQHAQTVVETKLLPMLLSEQFLIKPPKQSRVSLLPVFRRLVETWDPALLFLAQKWRGQSLPFLQMILVRIVQTLADEGAKQQHAGATRTVDTWTLDLLREWAVHLVKNHPHVLFKEDRPTGAAGVGADAASKKRGHAAMQSESTSPSSALDEVVHRCIKSLNPWLAPLLPLLFPLFKHQHSSASGRSSSEALARLELVLHVRTKNLYPSCALPAPSAAPPAVERTTPPTKERVEEFLVQHRSVSTAADAAHASSTASSASSAAGQQVSAMVDFPFLPIGLAPTDDGTSLWLEDEQWTWADEPPTPAPGALMATGVVASAAVAQPAMAPVRRDEEAMEVDGVAEAQSSSAPVEPSFKRARIAEPVAPVNPSLAAAQAQQQSAARAKAIEKLQQAIGWM